MSTILWLAGAEGHGNQEVMNQMNVRRRLMTFYYLRNKNEDLLDKLMKENYPLIDGEPQKIFFDSGAFSFSQEKKKLDTDEEEDFNAEDWWTSLDNYVAEYAAFLKKYREFCWTACEMDVDGEIGPPLPGSKKRSEEKQRRVDMLNEACPEHFRPEALKGYPALTKGEAMDEFGYCYNAILYFREKIMAAGVPVIWNWHPWRGFDEWERMCENHNFVGMARASVGLQEWNAFMPTAIRNQAVIHGFAMTKFDWLRKFPFYSVDSDTWNHGAQHGMTYIYDGGRIRTYDNQQKDVRKRYRQRYEEAGIMWDLIEQEDHRTIDLCNLLNWRIYGDWLELESTDTTPYWNYTHDGKKAKKREFVPIQVSKREQDTKMPFDQAIGSVIGVHCDTCHVQKRCPMAEEGADCYFRSPDFNPMTRNGQAKLLNLLMNIQVDRVFQGFVIERFDGGILDKHLSQQIEKLFGMTQAVQDMVTGAPQVDEEITVKRRSRGEAPKQGLMAELLSGLGGKKDDDEEREPPTKADVIEGEFEVSDEPPPLPPPRPQLSMDQLIQQAHQTEEIPAEREMDVDPPSPFGPRDDD